MEGVSLVKKVPIDGAEGHAKLEEVGAKVLIEEGLNGLERLGVLRALGRVEREVDCVAALPDQLGHGGLREVVARLDVGLLHKFLRAPGRETMVSASAGA